LKYAAFFRNVNLGHAGCPSKAALEAAFAGAGAADVASFQTNGTVCFALPARLSPRRLLSTVSRALNEATGLAEPVFVRRLDTLAALVASDPFTGVHRDRVHECCATLLSDGVTPAALPPASARGDVEVLRIDGGVVLSLSRRIGAVPGNPNVFVEKHSGRPATTRTWNTVVRLVRKFA
jgi:uncharacterized protein (DUF1697 family)